MEFWVLVGIGVIFYIAAHINDWIFINRMPPEGYKTDYSKMAQDISTGRVSRQEAIRRANRGEYTVRK